MSYDEGLADRIRTAIQDQAGVTEKRMFGGLAFVVNGHMAVGASGQGGLLLRVDPGETDSVVRVTTRRTETLSAVGTEAAAGKTPSRCAVLERAARAMCGSSVLRRSL